MFALKGRQDAFRLLLPKEFICKEIEEKYTNIIRSKHSFYYTPIDFLNETIQSVEVLGFNNGTTIQRQSSSSEPMIDPTRVNENKFMFPETDHYYRSEKSPIDLIDRTINIHFRHTLGYLNYFLLFENFWYQYTRDRTYADIHYDFNVDIFNEKGSFYSRIVLMKPLINSMDMLSFNFTQPVAQSETFQVEFKYQNFDFQFINIEDNSKDIVNVEDI